jgi:sulfur-oxidizing protein SoxY
MVAVMVEKNPSMMAGLFEFTDNAVPDVSMRVKMGQSSDVYALVKADGKFYMAKKEIKVTLGGCGG